MDVLPDTEPLLTLLALAEAGSESAAAESLGIGQSSVSRRIASLQRGSGEPLTQRTASGSKLTPAGERLLPYARELRASLNAAARLLAADAAGPLNLRFGMAPELAPRFAGALIISAGAPALESALFEIAVSEGSDERLLAAVRAGELHAALSSWAPAGREPGLETSRVTTDRLVIIGQPGGDLLFSGDIDAAELRRRVLLLPPTTGTIGRRAVAALSSAGLEPQAALTLGSQAAVLAAVQAGAGAGIVLASSCRAEVSAGWLTSAPLPGDEALVDVWLLLGAMSVRDAETVGRLVTGALELASGHL